MISLTGILLVVSCNTEQPASTAPQATSIAEQHVFFTSCSQCHIQQALPEFEGVPHGFAEDCAGCHTHPLFATVRPQHSRELCMGCHPNEAIPLETHPPIEECKQCHSTTTWVFGQ